MEIRALSWNLFHGRDFPPEPALRTWRSRLLRTTERGSTHAQVNRDLRRQFEEVLAELDWDVALLQECPPRWAERVADRCNADAHLALTSRNLPLLSPLQGLIADLDPDLIASWEGGSNLTLVRSPAGTGAAIADRSVNVLTEQPERRVMALSRLAAGPCIANLHASADHRLASEEVPVAAAAALEWAAGAPLLFGGDLNVRPARSPEPFARLRELGFGEPTADDAIDHLLGHGLEVLSPSRQLPPSAREVPDPTAPRGTTPLPVRLSDHAPVVATFATP
jgi:endonuclease/exonuclease/phosphatase family metal-dependent hydrolase